LNNSVLLLLVAACALISTQTFANALGLPTNTARVGISTGIAQTEISESITHTERSTLTQPYSLLYTDWLFKDFRFWSAASYQSADFHAIPLGLGQSVVHYQLQFNVHKNVMVNRWLMPWFGLGLTVSYHRFSKRHDIDEDGFLLTQYADEKVFDAGLNVSLIHDWPLISNWNFVTMLERDIIKTNQQNTLSFKIALLYKY